MGDITNLFISSQKKLPLCYNLNNQFSHIKFVFIQNKIKIITLYIYPYHVLLQNTMYKKDTNPNHTDFRDDINKALEALRNGGTILFPTDTVWAIGCDATNDKAVQKVLAIKNDSETSLWALIDNPAKLQSYLDEVPDMAWDLIELSEKPLTIIYPDAKNLACSLTGKDNSVGLRVTNESFSKNLCSRFRNPIAITAAQSGDKKTATSFSSISEKIKSAVDYIVTFRQNEHTGSDQSSLIKLGKGNIIEIIRK